MNCNVIHKKLIFYLEGDLPGQEAAEVSAHLEQCSECAAFADDMKKTLGMAEKEKSPEVNPFFYTRLKARMEKEREVVPQQVVFPLWRKVLQPAMFSLLLLAGIYTGIKIGQSATVELTTLQSAENELVPYLNEMEAEPIENFLME